MVHCARCPHHTDLHAADQKQLLNDLEGMLRPAELDRRDVDVIRKEVFSNNTFYVTSVTQVCSVASVGCPLQEACTSALSCHSIDKAACVHVATRFQRSSGSSLLCSCSLFFLSVHLHARSDDGVATPCRFQTWRRPMRLLCPTAPRRACSCVARCACRGKGCLTSSTQT